MIATADHATAAAPSIAANSKFRPIPLRDKMADDQNWPRGSAAVTLGVTPQSAEGSG
jgi:hypothetical protein